MNEQVKNVILASTVAGNVLRLPYGQLDRKVYMETAKQLGFIGGKWVSGKKGFVFANASGSELEDLIAESMNEGGVSKEDQYFPTPSEVASLMVSQIPLRVLHSKNVLEPSAGRGALVDALSRGFPDWTGKADCCETNTVNRWHLNKHSKCNLVGEDFLDYSPSVRYDVILANPPFWKNSDIAHIRHMFELLADGGILVTLSSPHWINSKNKKEVEFKSWLDSVGAEYRQLENGCFDSAGTSVAPILIVIEK